MKKPSIKAKFINFNNSSLNSPNFQATSSPITKLKTTYSPLLKSTLKAPQLVRKEVSHPGPTILKTLNPILAAFSKIFQHQLHQNLLTNLKGLKGYNKYQKRPLTASIAAFQSDSLKSHIEEACRPNLDIRGSQKGTLTGLNSKKL